MYDFIKCSTKVDTKHITVPGVKCSKIAQFFSDYLSPKFLTFSQKKFFFPISSVPQCVFAILNNLRIIQRPFDYYLLMGPIFMFQMTFGLHFSP